jgi:RNA polymerase sigma-70 factor (ECF subfamily)
LVTLLPEPEAIGLLALMLLHEARRPARLSSEGELIRLEEQDRTLWDQASLAEGIALVKRAWEAGPPGPYTLQAALAATHASAPTVAATNWDQVIHLYDLLGQVAPSPLVQINRAAAIAMRDGPQAGLDLMEQIMANGDLADYPLAHAARADLYRRLGRTVEARAIYLQALALPQPDPARRFIALQLASLPE